MTVDGFTLFQCKDVLCGVEYCELLISRRENEETLQPQTTDTHRDDKHPAEAVYPPTDQTRHTDVCTDKIKRK